MTKKRPHRLKMKILRYSLKILIVLLIAYGVISVIGLINDAIYKVKLEKIKVEHDVYYSNLFPIQKDWLPIEWGIQNCNAVNTYIRLFPLPPSEYANSIKDNPPDPELTKVFTDLGYASAEDLEAFVDKYDDFYKFNELFNAVKCSRLDALQIIENNERLSFPIQRYVKMIALSARINLIKGQYEEGLFKIYNAMLLVTDLALISNNSIDDMYSSWGLQLLYREIITLLLSNEVDFDKDSIQQLEKLIYLNLEKIKPEQCFYKEYLYNAANFRKLSIDWEFRHDFTYFLDGKLRYWKNGFSGFRMIYRMEKFYENLFEGLKFIRNDREKSVFTNNYFEKNDWEKHRFVPEAKIVYMFNKSRTFGKVALIISAINKHGIDSPEFGDLKSTDVFINELSGRPFEIIKEGNKTYIVFDEEYKLNLEKIDYIKQHKEILKSFHHFRLGSEN